MTTLTCSQSIDATVAVAAAIEASRTHQLACVRLSASPHIGEDKRELMVDLAYYHTRRLRCYEHLYRALGGDLYEYLPAVARLPEMAGCGRNENSRNRASESDEGNN